MLTAASAILLAVFTGPGSPWNWVLFISGVVTAGGAIYVESRRRSALERYRSKLSAARRALQVETNKVAKFRDEVETTAYDMLVALTKLCDGDANYLRTSIYHRHNDRWLRVGRYSGRTRYRESGREEISLGEGLLSRAFDIGYAEANLTDRTVNPALYESEQCRLGLHAGMSPSLVMAPRSYLLYLIEGPPTSSPGEIFILVFESDLAEGLDRRQMTPKVEPWINAIHVIYTRAVRLLE